MARRKAWMSRPSNYNTKFHKMAKHVLKLGATNAGQAKMFGVIDVIIDNLMSQRSGASKCKFEAIADVVLEYDRTKSTSRYLASGRRFANLETA
jgi:hypothetical protein